MTNMKQLTIIVKILLQQLDLDYFCQIFAIYCNNHCDNTILIILQSTTVTNRKKLAFAIFKKTIQHFAPFPKLIREMPLF